MLMAVYLGILAVLIGFILWNMFLQRDVFYQIECALALIPFVLRLLLIK